MTIKFLIIIILIGINGPNLNACICTMPRFDEEIQFTDEIFLGKIQKAERFVVTKRKDRSGNEEIFWGWRYYFLVEKKWKGNSQNEFIVEYYGSSCDRSFDLDSKNILVYADRTSRIKMLPQSDTKTRKVMEVIRISSCSRTISEFGRRDKNWYAEDVAKIKTRFPPRGVQLKSSENSSKELYDLYLFRNKWFKTMGILIIILISLNIFQFFRNRKNIAAEKG